MMAGAMMFALPSCAGLFDMLNEEGEENVTEDFAEQTKDEIRTWIQQLQAAMEIINEQATSPGE